MKNAGSAGGSKKLSLCTASAAAAGSSEFLIPPYVRHGYVNEGGLDVYPTVYQGLRVSAASVYSKLSRQKSIRISIGCRENKQPYRAGVRLLRRIAHAQAAQIRAGTQRVCYRCGRIKNPVHRNILTLGARDFYCLINRSGRT